MENSKRRRVEEILQECAPVLVCYSGGVDSSTLLAVATQVLQPEQYVAVLVDTPTLPRRTLEAALAQVEAMGVSAEVVRTGEFEREDFRANPVERCYLCKATWYAELAEFATRRGLKTILHGENADDDPNERPGARAAEEFGVVAPFREAGVTKREIRLWATELGLPCADAPASPCLATRIPHGMPITKELLGLVERGEEVLRSRGFRIVRVRIKETPRVNVEAATGCSGKSRKSGEPKVSIQSTLPTLSILPPANNALIQVSPEETPRLLAEWAAVREELLAVGFVRVEVDEHGYLGAGLL